MKVKLVNKSSNPTPAYSTAGAAGFDLRANIVTELGEPASTVLEPGKRMLIPTGLHMEIPEGHELQIRPRSGLAKKHGISVVNAPGTIDCDYRGDIGVILINHGEQDFPLDHGDRICQAVLKKVERAEFEIVETLVETERGAGGFGSTGKG